MKKIHMMGVGGVGMAGLAVLLKRRGNAVTGCDLKATPRTEWLESEGVPVSIGHDPAHVVGIDELIVTPAVHKDNPELVAAGNVRCRGEVLAELVNSAEDSIVVCGSHGKTTTATYIAKLLKALGERVEWCIGGETGEFPVAGGEGTLVCEGDESDGTLALYHAKTLVVTNVEYDHPDHFPTPADYEACFDTARGNAVRTVEGAEAGGPEFAALDPNARLAARVALGRGHPVAEILSALPAVTRALPDRRFQEIAPGVIIDYAHHPTEIAYTLRRARALVRPGGLLRALFQPHRYSRTKSLKRDFAEALALADEVVLCPTYGAFEAPVEGGDVADLYLQLRAHPSGVRVLLARSCEEAWEHASNSRGEGDLTLVLGAGDIIYRLKPPPPRKQWIGAGTNTWMSDLKLSLEYVKTGHPAGKTMDPALVRSLCPWMAGIPGTIGGWVKMNAGAHGHSISEVIEAVLVDGHWISAAECGFAYRHSDIQGEIQDVRWKSRSPAENEGVETYLAKRRKFPAGTYGSFFKNPPGDSAGRLLEAAGAKSLRVGGAYVWTEHANVIVRGENCTGSDVLALARLMRNAVFFRFGVELEPEVVM